MNFEGDEEAEIVLASGGNVTKLELSSGKLADLKQTQSSNEKTFNSDEYDDSEI